MSTTTYPFGYQPNEDPGEEELLLREEVLNWVKRRPGVALTLDDIARAVQVDKTSHLFGMVMHWVRQHGVKRFKAHLSNCAPGDNVMIYLAPGTPDPTNVAIRALRAQYAQAISRMANLLSQAEDLSMRSTLTPAQRFEAGMQADVMKAALDMARSGERRMREFLRDTHGEGDLFDED